MPAELITVHVGKCGSKIATEFWRLMCLEHGMDQNGHVRNKAIECTDRKSLFFTEMQKDYWKARALFLGLNPQGVIDVQISSPGYAFHEECFLNAPPLDELYDHTWSEAYEMGERLNEDILEALDREANGLDRLEGFLLTHSLCGGIGCGLTGFMLEKLQDHFPKALLQTYSIFPNMDDYKRYNFFQMTNAIVCLNYLTQHADCVVSVENSSLKRLAKIFRVAKPTLEHNNEMIAQTMVANFSPMRFPSTEINGLVSMLAPLIPSSKLHFLIPSYYPFALGSKPVRSVPKQGGRGVLRELIHRRNWLMTVSEAELAGQHYLASLSLVQGESTPKDVSVALGRMFDEQDLKKTPWGPISLQAFHCNSSPYVKPPYRSSGVLLGNHTIVNTLLERMTNPELLAAKFPRNQLRDLRESLELIASVRAEYGAAVLPDILQKVGSADDADSETLRELSSPFTEESGELDRSYTPPIF